MSSGFLGRGIGPQAFGGSGGLADPVPVLGANFLSNPGLELWDSSSNLTGISEMNCAQETSVVHGGTYAAKLTYSGGVGQIGRTMAGAAGWYEAGAWCCSSDGVGKYRLFLDSVPTGATGASLAPAWELLRVTARYASNPSIYVNTVDSYSYSIYVDDWHIKPLTLSSLFSTRAYASADCDLSGAVTRTAGTQAGLVARLDSAATPANFLIAYLDGTGSVKVDKCVGGTYTNVISGAVTYVAGRVLRLVCSGSDVSAYYHGTQVGSTVTVSDAGIVSNVLHGKFSTYASNTMAGFVAA